MTEAICRELSAAWEQAGVSFHFEQQQMQTQVARLMPVEEKTLCLSFEIRVLGMSGLLNLAFPAVVSNTILYRLAGGPTHLRQHTRETRKRMFENVGRARVGATLQLPSVRVSAEQIESLHAGSILRLQLAAHEEAELRVAGIPLFSARPVKKGESRRAHLVAPFTR